MMVNIWLIMDDHGGTPSIMGSISGENIWLMNVDDA